MAFDAGIPKTSKTHEDFSVINIGTNDRLSRHAVDATWGPGAKVERPATTDAVNDASLTNGTTQASFQRDQIPAGYPLRKDNYYSAYETEPGQRTPVPQFTSARYDYTPKPEHMFQT